METDLGEKYVITAAYVALTTLEGQMIRTGSNGSVTIGETRYVVWLSTRQDRWVTIYVQTDDWSLEIGAKDGGTGNLTVHWAKLSKGDAAKFEADMLYARMAISR